MKANLSLMGMYLYDKTILDNLVIPTGMDSDLLKENLLMEAAELEVLYTDFNFFKLAIGSWSKKQLPVWTELLKTTQYEYNPIWNKDGMVSEVVTRNLAATEDVSDVNTTTHADTDTRTRADTDTRTHDNTDTRTNDNTDTRTNDNTDTRTNDNTDTTTLDNTDEQTRDLAGTNDSTTSRGVFGYNSSTKAPESEDIIDQDTTDTGTVTDTHTGTITDEHTGTITDAHTGTITDAHTGTITDAHSGTITDEHTGTITDAHTGTITDAHTGTITDAHTGTITDARVIDRDTSDTGTIATYRTEQGNIGLTSTQDLIKAQREVVQINMMDIIIHDFIDRFCLKIY